MTYNNDLRIPRALFLSILFFLIAIILSIRIWGGFGQATLYGIAYVAQFGLILFALPRKKLVFRTNSFILILLYAVSIFLPLLINEFCFIQTNIYDYINGIIKILNILLLFGLIESQSITKRGFLFFMRAIVILSIAICLFSLIFEFRDIVSIPTISNTNVLKIRSFFINRNQYSAFLTIAFTANCFLISANKMRFNYIIAILQLFCILTTFSRASLVSIIILLFMIFIQSKKRSKGFILFSIISLLAILSLFLSGMLSDIAYRIFRIQNFDTGRVRIWGYAWDIICESNFLGNGFYTGVGIAQSRGMGFTQFHNMYLDTLVDGGIFELSILIIVLWIVYKTRIKRIKNPEYRHIYIAGFCAFLVYAFVESLSLFALSYGDTLYTIFYISIPILLSNMQESYNQVPSFGEPHVIHPEITEDDAIRGVHFYHI